MINNLTGSTNHTRCLCPITINSIASQLIKNGLFKTINSESARLVVKKISQLRRIPTPPDKCIFRDFFTKIFPMLFSYQSLEMLRALTLYAQSQYSMPASSLNKFLSSCMRQIKLPKTWRRALVVAIPKPNKRLGDPNSYRPISLFCVSFNILERLIYVLSNQLLTHCYLESKLGFGAEGQPQIKVLF